jgi:REP element-mobilizing transposase RayT
MFSMGRPTNIHFEGAVFHVSARGARQEDIFLNDADRRAFIALVERAKKRFKFHLLTLCLMSNHFHLLIQVRSVPLERIMQFIMQRYSIYFNRRTGRKGCLYDSRHFRGLVRTDGYLATVIRYINANPAKAGMVEASVDWPWSCAGQFFHRGAGWADLDAVAELFGGDLPPDLHTPVYDLAPEAYIAQKVAPLYHEEQASLDLEALADELRLSAKVLRGPDRLKPAAATRKAFVLEAARRGAVPSAIARFLGRTRAWASRVVNEAV